MISYAQNFEDVILWRALKDVPNGFYIDIGAQDPVLDSVSRHFYEAGWRGVHVEPTSTYAAKLRKDRPDEQVLQCAIGGGTAMRFFEIPDTGLSTGLEQIARGHEAAGYRVEEVLVPVKTLAQLFAEHPDRDIHWMKIDCEGMEQEILDSWGEATARPWVVVVESTVPGTQIAAYEGWEPSLLGRGYTFVYDDGVNRFYLSEAQARLREAFGPGPNCFDEFSVAPVTHMYRSAYRELAADQAAAAKLRSQIEEELRTKQRELSRLQGRVDREHERAAARQHEARLAELREQLEAERRSAELSAKLLETVEDRLAETQAAAGALRAELAAAKAQVEQMRSAADDLHTRVTALENSTSWRLTAPIRWVRRATRPPISPTSLPAPPTPAMETAAVAARPRRAWERGRRPARERSDLMTRAEQIVAELRASTAYANGQG